MTHRNTRRDFLKISAVGAAGLCTGRRVWGSSTRPANEKLGLAVVGISGQGSWNQRQLIATNEAIVAMCDVDNRRIGPAVERCPHAKLFVDFRRMLDEMDKQIDAVLVATPDHTHAVVTMAALKAGKHVYCEKPLTHSVWEAQQVIETARKQRRVTQMGTQMHATSHYRRVVERVQSGAVGKIDLVYVWCPTIFSGGDRPKESSPVPEGLDWDLWLGPAPERPYADKAYVPGIWRGWWDFGGGGHTDMACHYMDLPYWALKLGHPRTVEAEGPPPHPESTPDRLTVRYEYPARGNDPPVKLIWSVGVKHPTDYVEDKMPDWDAGVLFVGEKGMLAADYTRCLLLPEDQFAGFTPPAPFIPDSVGHHAEWIKAIKEKGMTTCNFAYSGVLTQAVLLGNVAYRSGRKIEWDPARLKLPNAPEAERFLRREYREGWKL